MHCQDEVRAACPLVPDFVWAARCRNIVFLSPLQRLIDIGGGDIRLRYRCLCLPNGLWRHAFGGAQPSLLEVKKMRLLG